MNPYKPKDEGVKDVFIMRDTGECVFHETLAREDSDPIQADQTIMSSFLSAIETFSSNVDVGAKMLETTNYRFVYHRNNEYIYVARTKKNVNPDDISEKLSKISTTVNTEFQLPKKWDGNVDRFKGVSELLENQFSKSELNQYYEITGRSVKKLEGVEAKIYSFLRFRGKSSLSTITDLMKIPQKEALQVTSKLVEKKYLEACS